MASRIEKLRNLFLFTFFLLVISIIFTPLLTRTGFSVFSEEVLESILLLLQISVAWKFFWLYEGTVKHREKEIQILEREYQKREKELLEAFAYLGKVNVQVSLIKDFMQKIKTPTNKKEFKEYLDEVLHMALHISQKRWMMVRIINTENMQTVAENWISASKKNSNDMKIGNREILEMSQDQALCEKRKLCVLSSAGSKPYKEKAFLIFEEKKEVDREVFDFLKAAVNQCEIIHSLFALGHGKK